MCAFFQSRPGKINTLSRELEEFEEALETLKSIQKADVIKYNSEKDRVEKLFAQFQKTAREIFSWDNPGVFHDAVKGAKERGADLLEIITKIILLSEQYSRIIEP
ncbi:MAG TPA: hypothetical protein VJI75_03990 [Candidatus Nanoarchaeia archaeon]|nr:hypothetical protein [Candidatus Nanoarchaeia archaeon]